MQYAQSLLLYAITHSVFFFMPSTPALCPLGIVYSRLYADTYLISLCWFLYSFVHAGSCVAVTWGLACPSVCRQTDSWYSSTRPTLMLRMQGVLMAVRLDFTLILPQLQFPKSGLFTWRVRFTSRALKKEVLCRSLKFCFGLI